VSGWVYTHLSLQERGGEFPSQKTLLRLTHLPLLLSDFRMDNRIVVSHPSTLVGASAVEMFELSGRRIHHLGKASLSEKGFHLLWFHAKNALFPS